MLISILMAVTLLFAQTPEAGGDDTNVFLDLGSEHCATEIAFAAYEPNAPGDFATEATPAYVTYSAFQFESADQAEAALDDVPVLVAETFSDDPNISESEDFDRIVTEVETQDYGDQAVAYVMVLPVDNEDLEVLTVELLGIVKADQMMLILMFSNTGTTRAGVGLTLETIPPFAEDLDEEWDGTGELQDAMPDEDELPVGWEGRQVTIEDPPSC